MAKKRPFEINPHQGILLEHVAEGEVISIRQFADEPAEKLLGHGDEHTVTYGELGTQVDVAERAKHLTEALAAFGQRNIRLGFDLASNTRRHSGPIWGRYTYMTPRVQEGAEANTHKFLDEAKRRFWRATGYSALRQVQYAPKHELDAEARKMWREFVAAYGDPSKQRQRDAFKKILAKEIKTSERIKKQVKA